LPDSLKLYLESFPKYEDVPIDWALLSSVQ
jgi:hypothetical protein